MIKHSKSLSRKVESYLKFLTKPREEFNGQAICPGLAPYRHQVMLLMARDDIEDQINQVADLLYPLNVPAAIIATALPPTDLIEITDATLNRRIDIEIFITSPQTNGKVRGVYTGFKDGTLIIIQRTDLLDKSRQIAKNTGYYSK